MSVRYDRIAIRMEYTDDFGSLPSSKSAVTWQFLPIDKREARLAILLKWWHEDNTPAEANLDIS